MKSKPIDKRELLKLLRAKLEADLSSFTASQDAAQAGAVHEEARQEDPKDTRAIEAGYLARGLAERVEFMRDTVAMFAKLEVIDYAPEDPIGITALVVLEIEGDEKEAVYFIVPGAAGETVVIAKTTIRTLTPGSPLGQALIGKQVDDDVDVDLPGGKLIGTIASVH